MVKHGRYFLNKDICEALDSPDVEQEPFNMLSRDEWYQIVNHVIAHEVQPHMQHLIPKGATMNSLNDGDVSYFLWVTLERYLQTNSAKPRIEEDGSGIEEYRHRRGLLPEEEIVFGRRASDLYFTLERKFKVFDKHLHDNKSSRYNVVPIKKVA